MSPEDNFVPLRLSPGVKVSSGFERRFGQLLPLPTTVISARSCFKPGSDTVVLGNGKRYLFALSSSRQYLLAEGMAVRFVRTNVER